MKSVLAGAASLPILLRLFRRAQPQEPAISSDHLQPSLTAHAREEIQTRGEEAVAQLAEFLLARSDTAGMACAVVKDGTVMMSHGWGLANLERNIKFSAQTICPIASVTKLVAAVAVMMLVERRLLQLDEPVSTYLDFTVQHPKFPEVGITLRHLLSHTSSIRDSEVPADAQWSTALS